VTVTWLNEATFRSSERKMGKTHIRAIMTRTNDSSAGQYHFFYFPEQVRMNTLMPKQRSAVRAIALLAKRSRTQLRDVTAECKRRRRDARRRDSRRRDARRRDARRHICQDIECKSSSRCYRVPQDFGLQNVVPSKPKNKASQSETKSRLVHLTLKINC